LPLGISLGGSVGFVHGLALWTLGTELKVAIIEGALNRWLPDLAVRVASNSLGRGRRAVAELVRLRRHCLARISRGARDANRPLRRARSGAEAALRGGVVDLTPNVDANACLAGNRSVCNAQGLGASSDDLGTITPSPSCC
jgi:hypothetical protein